MNCFDEHGQYVPYERIEVQEQHDANYYIRPDDKVLEIGARYGGVSITINKILKNKRDHVAVEPDSTVWESLEKNRDRHWCEFQICKGAISERPLKINDGGYEGFGNYTSEENDGNIELFKISDFNIDFNVLVVDCEGAFENFYNENKDFFKNLRLILYERDRKEHCDYDYLEKEFLKMGFKKVNHPQAEHIAMLRELN
jgi:FkbM family methyltransferase